MIRPGYKPKPNSPQASYYTGTHSAHNYAYDVNGKCPTLTTAYTVIFDDTIGVFRRLSSTELLRVHSLPNTFSFPAGTTDRQKCEQIGRSMEGSSVRAIGTAFPHIYVVSPTLHLRRSL